MTEHNAYTLARLAEVQSPDSLESAGARFLISIANAVDDLDADDLTNEDQLTQIADDAPDIYTHTMWSEFVDLCAYQEDPTELGADASNMDQCARICLYMIAQRLTTALVTERLEAVEA